MARKPRLTSITSAASRVISPERPEARSLAPDAQSLYGLYDRLGQIRAALQFKAMAASKIDYYPARRLESGTAPERSEEPRVVEAFDRLQGPLGEFADFVSEFCLHLDIAGEGYLVGNVDDDWDVWSPVEYEDKRKNLYRSTQPDAVSPLEGDDFVLRVWRPHPMRRELPDSALRSVQSECIQYMQLRGLVTAVSNARLIGGILGVPEELSFPPKANGDPADPFFDTLLDAIEAAVENPDSTQRIAPVGIQGPADLIDKINYVDLKRDLPEWVPTLMERVLRQIATGLDLPADILLGLADVNHWNAWLSEDSAKLDYVDPLVLLILDSLTRGYLHPTLTEMGVADPESYVFWRDYSDLIARSVGSEDAIALYELDIISADAVRRVVGFTDSDAPDEAEVEAKRPAVVEPVFPAGPDNVIREIPQTLVAAGQKIGLGQIDHRLYTQLAEASQAALDRALERAGQKIRTHAVGSTKRSDGSVRPPKHATLAAQIDGVPNRLVSLTVGPAVRDTLQLTDDDLIPEGTFDHLTGRIERILEAGQSDTYTTISDMTGATPPRDEPQERSWIEAASALLITGLGALALRKLFTPDLELDPAESGEISDTQIPADLIFDTLTVAGGGQPGFGPEAPRGLANGEQAQRWIVEAGYRVREREWTVGAPAKPFEPHRNLRGTRFEQWTDPALTNYTSWLGVSFMFPGDHKGCVCSAELVIEEAADLLVAV